MVPADQRSIRASDRGQQKGKGREHYPGIPRYSSGIPDERTNPKKIRTRDYQGAMLTAEEGLRYYGEFEGFLYFLAISQRRVGKTGKCVKNFERLVQLFPDKLIYRKELAFSYMERGFMNKAYQAFQTARKSFMEFLHSAEPYLPEYEEELLYLTGCIVANASFYSDNGEPVETIVKEVRRICSVNRNQKHDPLKKAITLSWTMMKIPRLFASSKEILSYVSWKNGPLSGIFSVSLKTPILFFIKGFRILFRPWRTPQTSISCVNGF